MHITDFIIFVFCLVDHFFKKIVGCLGSRLRKRGFNPKLTDQEVITMELVGEYLGIDTDKGIWSYFKRHWFEWFPNLGSRSNFSKQASNLWVVKEMIREKLVDKLMSDKLDRFISDGFPMPICHYARAYRQKSFRGEASYGYCASKDEKYYGLKGNIVIQESGIIQDITVTAANIDDRESLYDVIGKIKGELLGDKGYLSGKLKDELLRLFNINLWTPKRKKMDEPATDKYKKKHFGKIRRTVETVISQLKEQFKMAKVWARDSWHMTNRVTRKVLAHTVAIAANVALGRKTLQFQGLVV